MFVFADADRISALVTMLGFHNGRAVNTIAPFGAACHSIVFAAEQLGSDDPMAVMGLFDISQRGMAIAGYLSLTMPFELWEGMQEDLDKSCLTTHAWRESRRGYRGLAAIGQACASHRPSVHSASARRGIEIDGACCKQAMRLISSTL